MSRSVLWIAIVLSVTFGLGCGGKRAADEAKAYKPPAGEAKVLFFTAQWCGYCRQMKPSLDYLRRKYPTVEFAEVDVDLPANKDAQRQYRVDGLPTSVVLSKGEEIGRIGGFLPYQEFSDELQRILDQSAPPGP